MTTTWTKPKAIKTFEARELPLKAVTVFTDRAEIRRVFNVTLDEGLTDVIVENVASAIDSDSIRIDGHGTATIHEVQFKTDYATEAEVDSPQVKELVQELEKLQFKLASTKDLKTVYQKRLDSLNNMVEKLHLQTEHATITAKFDESVQDNIEALYAYHEKKSVDVQALIRSAETEVKQLEAEERKLNQKIAEMRSSGSQKRSIVITLESFVKSEVEMDLTYQVYEAYWTPSYDVRITTDPVATTKAQMKLYYFGNIRQSTGEDWRDVQLVLSTAQPRLAGPLPKLGTLRAKFHKEEPPKPCPVRPMMAMRNIQYDADNYEQVVECAALGAPVARRAKMAHQNLSAEKQSLSTTFLVPQSKTIPSDSSEHKVTIVCLQFEPLLHLDCVPSKNTNVFLTATAINCSDYPLLAGWASIYVDNSFSSKVYIDPVATGDKFDCPVGVDSSIKIQYKPANTFQQQSGVMTKTSSSMHEQKLVVKNTKTTEPILLTIYEQVPKSTDEKIKVKLYSPEVKAANTATNHSVLATNEDLKTLKLPDVGARLNTDHNLEWTVLLSESEERELIIKWGVESPATETVEYVEDRP